MKRILLAAPVSNKKAYVLDEWLQHIRQFSYPAYDILLVDNSHDEHYHQSLWDKGFQCLYCPPGNKRAPEYIADSQNMLRDYFLKEGYDYLFSLECDNFPPLDIIELMLGYKVDNFNIPYFLKKDHHTTLGVQKSVINYGGWCANKVLAPADSVAEFDGKVKYFYAPSFGCSLFSRRLVERVRYRVEANNPFAFSDSFWHMDSNKLGIRPWVHMGIICEHRRFTWQHNPDLVGKEHDNGKGHTTHN
ncbi:MAG: hypothetical protein SFW35_00885 [Chitinophagales bacterium]|nr:hypothetical protein [Chitinophagales bacterium]